MRMDVLQQPPRKQGHTGAVTSPTPAPAASDTSPAYASADDMTDDSLSPLTDQSLPQPAAVRQLGEAGGNQSLNA
jgi:hypothetical protein